MKANTDTTCPLIQEIKKEASRQFALLKQLPIEIRKEQWLAERIAYQIGWGQLLLYWYNTGIDGKTPQMPGDGFAKWDYKAISNHFYKKYLYDQGKEQEKCFQNIISEVLVVVEKEYKTGDLDRLGIWPWCTLPSGKEWPLSKWVRVNTISPWKATSSLLKKAIF
jgi:hypothetical protein